MNFYPGAICQGDEVQNVSRALWISLVVGGIPEMERLNMTPEKQRIAIAEACGWYVMNGVIGELKPDKNNEPVFHPASDLPDYTNDLNACYEMEEWIIGQGMNDWFLYQDMLFRIVPGCLGLTSSVHATASERTEAFLKTLNKWKE